MTFKETADILIQIKDIGNVYAKVVRMTDLYIYLKDVSIDKLFPATFPEITISRCNIISCTPVSKPNMSLLSIDELIRLQKTDLFKEDATKEITLRQSIKMKCQNSEKPNVLKNNKQKVNKQLKKEWNQFEANKELFGIEVDFDIDEYSIPIDRNAEGYQEKYKAAQKVANEILSSKTTDKHILEERSLTGVYKPRDECSFSTVKDTSCWKQNKRVSPKKSEIKLNSDLKNKLNDETKNKLNDETKKKVENLKNNSKEELKPNNISKQQTNQNISKQQTKHEVKQTKHDINQKKVDTNKIDNKNIINKVDVKPNIEEEIKNVIPEDLETKRYNELQNECRRDQEEGKVIDWSKVIQIASVNKKREEALNQKLKPKVVEKISVEKVSPEKVSNNKLVNSKLNNSNPVNKNLRTNKNYVKHGDAKQHTNPYVDNKTTKKSNSPVKYPSNSRIQFGVPMKYDTIGECIYSVVSNFKNGDEDLTFYKNGISYKSYSEYFKTDRVASRMCSAQHGSYATLKREAKKAKSISPIRKNYTPANKKID